MNRDVELFEAGSFSSGKAFYDRSVAISLKRIADALEKQNEMTEEMNRTMRTEHKVRMKIYGAEDGNQEEPRQV